MRFSIIVPVYKVEKYILSCLNSIVVQTYSNIECVIVNDDSPDSSMDIVNSFLAGYSGNVVFKIVEHQQNKGLSAARNSGIKEASGDYIFFLDSDDELLPNAMQEFSNLIERYGDVDFLIGSIEVLGNFTYKPLHSYVYLASNENIVNAYLCGDWFVMACGKLIRRDFFIHNNLWFKVGILHEDELFSFHLAMCASSMISTDKIVYKYIIRNTSITANKNEKNYRDFLWIVSENVKMVESKVLEQERKKFVDYFISLLYGYSLEILKGERIGPMKKRDLIRVVGKILDEVRVVGRINTFKCFLEYCILKAPYVVIFTIAKIRRIIL